MTTLREAAQQALEALEYRDGDGADQWKADVITALRAALAKPCPCGNRPVDQCPGEWEPGCDLGNNPKHAAPPRCPNCASLEAQNTELDRRLADRKPLTEEEIGNVANSVKWSQQYHVDFARAIEAAHGIIETKIKGDKA